MLIIFRLFGMVWFGLGPDPAVRGDERRSRESTRQSSTTRSSRGTPQNR